MQIAQAQVKESLARRMLRGALWSMVGYGATQVLRLASNLVLAHLLAPEYFGLVALVNVFIIGLAMFSDIGFGPNIVQSDRGDDPDFLNTAFTVQFIRAGIIWLCCLIGALPFARFYEEPQFVWLVPAAGFAALISGLNSTKIFTAYRRIDFGRLTLIDLIAQGAAIIAMIAWALIAPSVWALIAGAIVAALVKMVASHLYLPGVPNRFRWDPTSVSSLVSFGKWIFLSTILSFTTNGAGNLILGKFAPMAEVGIFSIAVTLSKVIELAYEAVSSKVLLPVFAEIKNLEIGALRERVRRIRLGVMAAFLPPLWFMAIFGQQIMELLFDSRYHSGGWILQIFSVCAIPLIVTGIGQFYLAKGNSFLLMKLSATRLVFYLGCIWVGWMVAGTKGIIIGMAVHTFLTYVAELLVQRYYRIWLPQLDVAAMAISAAVIYSGLKLQGLV